MAPGAQFSLLQLSKWNRSRAWLEIECKVEKMNQCFLDFDINSLVLSEGERREAVLIFPN